MTRIATVLAVPGLLGGAGLFYDGTGSPPRAAADPLSGGYVVEVGVAFPEAAVRAALPAGLAPAPGFTGGIAVYGGDEGWALSPLAMGYVWVDVAGADGAPSRFMVQGFATEGRGGASPIPADLAAFGETHELGPDGHLSATAWPDRGSALDLEVRVDAASCRDGLSPAGGRVLVEGPDGSLGVIHMPVILDLCEAEALSARIEAPSSHVLGPFEPERVIWAGVGTPLRWAMPEL